uniref:CDAN1-interacting nuclease 1 n=1 Tax=Amblyomma aureolatum TaxID=187763 RepID=A0A1E1X4X3_9ACAR
MKLATYEAIVQKLHTLNLRNCLDEVRCCFPDVDVVTLRSIISSEVQRHIKRTYHTLVSPPVANEHYNFFKASVATCETPGFLLRYADEQGVSPALMARLILEKRYETEAERPSKQDISQMLKNSASIQDGALAAEVFMCVVNDNNYGPLGDAMKNSVGVEYEIHLKTELETLGLTFVNENVLRERGYDKTPDVKLELPIVVEGTIVTWIESKAQFGDPDCHRIYSRDQYQSYWNRFGRGLVIYWFGFVDEIVGSRDEGFIIRDHMPKNVVRMEDAMGVAL